MAASWVRIGSLVGALAAWEFAARLVGNRLVPPVSAVVATLVHEATHGPLLHNLGVTLARVAGAFALAMLIGAPLGYAMGRARTVNAVLDAPVLALLNVPALVMIALAYVWFGLGEGTAVVAVALTKLPNTAVTVREGARTLDPALAEMADAFGVTAWDRAWAVVLPQLTPYLLAAARGGLALIWKIVLVAELLGRSDGVGFAIQVQFQTFDVAGILAYTLAFVLVVQAIETAALRPLERAMSRWR